MDAADFTDADSLVYDVASNWEKKTSKVRNVRLQTDWIEAAPVATQTHTLTDGACQTDSKDVLYGIVSNGGGSVQDDSDEENTRSKAFVAPPYDAQKLLDFIGRVGPLMETELSRAARSSAFDGFVVPSHLGRASVTELHTMYDESVLARGLYCTGVSWNSTGGLLAASYGRFDVKDWCVSKGAVCVWAPSRRTFTPSKAHWLTDTPSYAMCVEFHPSKPSLVAVGTFTGEILLFDVGDSADEGGLIAKTVLEDQTHREPVSRLLWWEGSRGRTRLLSVGQDGMLLVWDPANALTFPIGGFKLSVRTSSLGKISGGTAACLSPFDSDSLLVGTESGGVLKVSLSADPSFSMSDPSPKSEPTLSFPSPITFSYASHAGPVYGANLSPFHRNAAVTCSSDGTVRLYNSLTKAPMAVLEPSTAYLYSLAWSLTRPAVLFVGAGDGILHVYDLKASVGAPLLRLEAGTQQSPVHSIAVCKGRPSLVGTGDGFGHVRVFELSSHLVTPSASEVSVLDALIGKA